MINRVLFIEHGLPFGKCYLYSPRPVFLSHDQVKILIDNWGEISGKRKIIFIRGDFRNGDMEGFRKVSDLQPVKTIILDLGKSEEEIFSGMHQKTRYNIRLARRYGVEVFPGEGKEYQEIFFDLLRQTAERDKFRIYPKDYYVKLLNMDPAFSRLHLAKYQNKILAAHLMIFFGKTVTYLHGASSRENREVMAPYALHWECIKEARRLGFRFYDFWGVDEKKWPGLTRFKKGFGGQLVDYPGTFDLPLSRPWYFLYKIGKLCFRLF